MQWRASVWVMYVYSRVGSRTVPEKQICQFTRDTNSLVNTRTDFRSSLLEYRQFQNPSTKSPFEQGLCTQDPRTLQPLQELSASTDHAGGSSGVLSFHATSSQRNWRRSDKVFFSWIPFQSLKGGLKEVAEQLDSCWPHYCKKVDFLPNVKPSQAQPDAWQGIGQIRQQRVKHFVSWEHRFVGVANQLEGHPNGSMWEWMFLVRRLGKANFNILDANGGRYFGVSFGSIDLFLDRSIQRQSVHSSGSKIYETFICSWYWITNDAITLFGPIFPAISPGSVVL